MEGATWFTVTVVLGCFCDDTPNDGLETTFPAQLLELLALAWHCVELFGTSESLKNSWLDPVDAEISFSGAEAVVCGFINENAALSANEV